jgi:hypothetical protein
MKGGEKLMTNFNKQTIINRDSARIAGIQKHSMTQASILVAGVSYTPAQAIQVYQDDLDATQAVAQAKSALKAALAKSSTVRSVADTFDSAFKRCIEGAYIGQPDTLDDFGIDPVVRSTPSVATKAAAAVKTEATRAARHIMGKKQRSQIQAPGPSEVAASATPEPAPAVNGAAPVSHP